VRRHVEVVVVLFVIVGAIALLFAVFCPRVQVTDSNTRTMYNLHACALAAVTYEGDYKRLPDAFFAGGSHTKPKSVWFHLLPYVDASHVYQADDSGANVSAFRAESDLYVRDSAGKVNFAANLRLFAHQTYGAAACDRVGGTLPLELDGNLLRSGLTRKRIADGDANVLMMVTRYADCGSQSTFYAAHPSMYGGFFGAGSYVKSASRVGGEDDRIFQIAPEMKGPNACNPAPGIYGHSFWRPRLHAAFADGSVRYVSASVEPIVFQRALCPGDGAKIEAEDWNR
jgi:hypothetical protein